MKRFAVPLVIAGSLTVLVALLMLLRSITSTAPAAPVVATTNPPRAPAGPVPAPATPSLPATGTPSTVPKVAARPPTTGDRLPALPSGGTSAPTAGGSEDAPPATKLNTKNLHLGMPALREKIAGNTSAIAACLAGKSSTAEVKLTFIAAQKGDRIEIEQADIETDKTTLEDQAVLDCMMAATRTIRLDGLPREAAAILVYRQIVVENGGVSIDRPTTFSYIR